VGLNLEPLNKFNSSVKADLRPVVIERHAEVCHEAQRFLLPPPQPRQQVARLPVQRYRGRIPISRALVRQQPLLLKVEHPRSIPSRSARPSGPRPRTRRSPPARRGAAHAARPAGAPPPSSEQARSPRPAAGDDARLPRSLTTHGSFDTPAAGCKAVAGANWNHFLWSNRLTLWSNRDTLSRKIKIVHKVLILSR
jgi:hypothetical protein